MIKLIKTFQQIFIQWNNNITISYLKFVKKLEL